MCLNTVWTGQKLPQEVIGWKVLSVQSKSLYSGPSWGIRVRVGKWTRDPKKKVVIQYRGWRTYPAGFHIFESKDAAVGLRPRCLARVLDIRKVRLRGLVAVGTQDKHKVYVGKSLFVYKKEKKDVS